MLFWQKDGFWRTKIILRAITKKADGTKYQLILYWCTGGFINWQRCALLPIRHFLKILRTKNDFKMGKISKFIYTQYRYALLSQIIKGIQPCITIFSYWFFWHRKVDKYLLVVSLTKKKGKKQLVFLLTKKNESFRKDRYNKSNNTLL